MFRRERKAEDGCRMACFRTVIWVCENVLSP